MSCSLLCLHRKESILITLAAMIRAVTSVFLDVSPGMIALLIFSTFAVTTGQPLSPAIVFTSISLLSYLRFNVIMLMLRGILGLQEGRVAFQRIEVHMHMRTYMYVHTHIHVCTYVHACVKLPLNVVYGDVDSLVEQR